MVSVWLRRVAGGLWLTATAVGGGELAWLASWLTAAAAGLYALGRPTDPDG